MTRLFAYGTLRDPRRLATLLGSGGLWRIGEEATIQGQLYDVGEYPALVQSDDPRDRVSGVLIELSDPRLSLPLLDAYEGVDAGLYRREAMPVQLATGSVEVVWVYVYQHAVSGLRRIERWP